MAKVSVIVVAAGSGDRFGGQENKIHAKLEGQPLFLRALQLFVNRDDVCQTLLVVSPKEIEDIKSKFGPNIGFMGAELVAGGKDRHDSVAHGLSRVHMAGRPDRPPHGPCRDDDPGPPPGHRRRRVELL